MKGFQYAPMSDSGSGSDEFGMLEDIELAEPLEEVSEQPRAIRKLTAAESEGIRDLIASYAIIPLPVAILDSSFSFIYRNKPLDDLLRSFDSFDKQTLLAAIGRFMDEGVAKELYTGLKEASNGHSWSGTIRLKSKKTSSVLAKTTIIPFKPAWANKTEPYAWVAFFDDVTEERNSFLKGLFTSLLEASKLKDNDTGKHIERVNYYTELMAREIYRQGTWPEVDIDFIENIGFLAAMHDVGKIGTPDDILNKKGPLDEFEWNIMREHTINGAFILSSYPNPMAKQIAQSHHEWWNGTGYPYNLFGEMIPLPARIVAIADVYDALRMRRSYKEPFDHPRASLLIIADDGKHFDPALVTIFKRIESEFDQIFRTYTD